MPVIHLADLATTRWKNGHGRRAVLAEGDGWSVTVAWIDSDAAFSDFTGHDRTTVLLHGRGFALHHRDQPPLDFGAVGTVHAYPGDRPARAELLSGPCQVLNITTRRDAFTHRLHVGGLLEGHPAVILAGGLRLGSEVAGPGDAVLPPHPELQAPRLRAATPWITPVAGSSHWRRGAGGRGNGTSSDLWLTTTELP